MRARALSKQLSALNEYVEQTAAIDSLYMKKKDFAAAQTYTNTRALFPHHKCQWRAYTLHILTDSRIGCSKCISLPVAHKTRNRNFHATKTIQALAPRVVLCCEAARSSADSTVGCWSRHNAWKVAATKRPIERCLSIYHKTTQHSQLRSHKHSKNWSSCSVGAISAQH